MVGTTQTLLLKTLYMNIRSFRGLSIIKFRVACSVRGIGMWGHATRQQGRHGQVVLLPKIKLTDASRSEPLREIRSGSVAHSRGSLTTSNATHAQLTAGSTDVPLAHVQFHGAAANAQRMADRVAQATGGSGSVWQATHKDDLVSTLIGGNAATGGRDAGFLKAHGTYGPGFEEKDRKQIWGAPDGSRPVRVDPKN